MVMNTPLNSWRTLKKEEVIAFICLKQSQIISLQQEVLLLESLLIKPEPPEINNQPEDSQQ